MADHLTCTLGSRHGCGSGVRGGSSRGRSGPMISAIFEVLFYALAAAASPLVLTATFIVVRGKRPRTNGIAFLSGFGFGTIIACGLGLVLGTAAVDQLDAHETFKALVAIALGLALLWV
ncbi:MAG TPA: hypothetical protein DEQ43_06560, partial [Nocardioides bacterium]|nr:hypothetical protein [Nocardioides sp.]